MKWIDRTIGVAQAAHELDLSPARVSQLAAQGRFVAKRLGRDWAIDLVDLRRFAKIQRPAGKPRR